MLGELDHLSTVKVALCPQESVRLEVAWGRGYRTVRPANRGPVTLKECASSLAESLRVSNH